MLRKVFLFALALPLAAFAQSEQVAVWERAGFMGPRFETWEVVVPGARFTHQLDMNVVLFRNAGWDRDEVFDRIQRLGQIISQCGIKISKVDFVEAEAPHGWVDIDTGNRDAELARLTPLRKRPIFYYVRSHDKGQLAYTWMDWYHIPAMRTTWVTTAVKGIENRGYDPSANPEAHEMGHLLLRAMGHDVSGRMNFLAGQKALLNDQITVQQCDLMKKHPLVRRIP